jgi:energy-converting hydrogenase B subunit Q
MGENEIFALSLIIDHQPGVLRDIATVIAQHQVNITMVQQSVIETGPKKGKAFLYFELESDGRRDQAIEDLKSLACVQDLVRLEPFNRIFGSRVIIIGGGAQVAQVALGAVNEADRHNIRGERISVDTIPLVGEEDLARAVDAVARLPRAGILVLAGSLMGGEVSRAVDRVREAGIPVIALRMAGSVPAHADLVVTDPIQAGVFAVMHISSKAVFDVERVRGKEF